MAKFPKKLCNVAIALALFAVVAVASANAGTLFPPDNAAQCESSGGAFLFWKGGEHNVECRTATVPDNAVLAATTGPIVGQQAWNAAVRRASRQSFKYEQDADRAFDACKWTSAMTSEDFTRIKNLFVCRKLACRGVLGVRALITSVQGSCGPGNSSTNCAATYGTTPMLSISCLYAGGRDTDEGFELEE